jgi:hypothetical protein
VVSLLFYASRGSSVVLFYSWQISDFILVVVGQWFYFSCGKSVVLC